MGEVRSIEPVVPAKAIFPLGDSGPEGGAGGGDGALGVFVASGNGVGVLGGGIGCLVGLTPGVAVGFVGGGASTAAKRAVIGPTVCGENVN